MKIADLDWKESILDLPDIELVLRIDNDFNLSSGFIDSDLAEKYPWWAPINNEFMRPDRCLPRRAELKNTLYPDDDDGLLSDITETIYSGTIFLVVDGNTDDIERGMGVSGTIGLPLYLVYNHDIKLIR